jgi:hypothetical protein
MHVGSAELEDSIKRPLPGRRASEVSMPFAALFTRANALAGGTQLEVGHAAVKLVVSYRHETERA